MRPGNTITSKMINLHAAYLCEAQLTTWFFPTNFSGHCQGSDKQCGRYYSLNTIIIDCELHKFNRRLKHFCKIFIPVHDETLDHWFLFLIKVCDEVVEIWDSKADMASSRRRHEIATSVGNQWDVNGFKNGIYLMRHMQLYGEPWFDGFESNKERTELALSIVKNSNNEELRSLKVAAGVSVVGNNQAFNQTNLDVDGDAQDEGARAVDKGNHPTGRKMRSHRKGKDLA
uniref:uncharacterized protein LOC105351597 n=1 Tax=Fragaria vesca subsp. vesca TaxID=101020 RepID=UPI0005CB3D30|nr:PREDICTED: uncharacterized protein LOC105351597 [Fragaria vesca subsp. vesca]